MASGYEQTVGSGTTTPLPSASPDEFGAGVGAAITGLGDQMSADHQRMQQLHLDQREELANAEFAKNSAQSEADFLGAKAGMDMPVGGVGWADQVNTTADQTMQDVIPADATPRQRLMMEAQVAGFKSRQIGQAHVEAAQALAAKIGQDGRDGEAIRGNIIQSQDISTGAAARAAFQQQIVPQADFWEGTRGISDDAKSKGLHGSSNVFATNAIQTLTRSNPSDAIDELHSGYWDNALTKEGAKDELIKQAEAEQRRQAGIAQHQLELQKAAAEHGKQMLKAHIASGDVPADADFNAAMAASHAAGDNVGVYEMSVEQAKARVNHATQPWLPSQYANTIDALEAKGDRRTSQENIELAQLKQVAPGRISEFNKDSGNWAALNGMPRPNLDLTDQNSITANANWRGTVQKASGRAPLILPPEMAQDLAQQAQAGPAGQVQVANQIAALGAGDARQAARQVAPNDVMLPRLMTLQPPDRAAYVNGAEARKAHPQLVDGPRGNEARSAFDDYTGGALSLMPQGDVASAFEAARNIYADGEVKRGAGSQVGVDPARLGEASSRALGGAHNAAGQQLGGIGNWNGAKVLLPATASQNGFEAALSGLGWGKDWAHAPVWTNGVSMTADELRRSFTPVARPDGTYEFHNSRGEVLHGRQGGIWRLDISRLIK